MLPECRIRVRGLLMRTGHEQTRMGMQPEYRIWVRGLLMKTGREQSRMGMLPEYRIWVIVVPQFRQTHERALSGPGYQYP
jgi:hypothetical protein